MTRTLIAALTLAGLCLLSAQPASAAVGDVTPYDAVDAIKVVGTRIDVTGIIAGQSGPSTITYFLLTSGAVDIAARCDRLALLAMSKPGRFQFALVQENPSATSFSCKLIVRTP